MPASKKTPVSVFISSTFNDLKEYRSEVEKQLISLENAVKGMEHFGSSSSSPLEVCYKKIEECNLVILLLGLSYGSIEPNSGKSFTELEYDYATELGKPVLAYVADTASAKLGIPYDSIDSSNSDKLKIFKEKVSSSHTVSKFASVEELGESILHDVPDELEKLNKIPKVEPGDVKTEVDDEQLKEGANIFEKFWLRPMRFADKLVPLRLRINKKFSGWKVKDELISALGLTVGDCITTEVTVMNGSNIIDDDGDTDLFADGVAADWLMDATINTGVVEGCIIDCYARLKYCKAPVGANGKIVNKASLILEKGIRSVGVDKAFIAGAQVIGNRDLADILSGLTR